MPHRTATQADGPPAPSRTGNVRSIGRALGLIEIVAANGGVMGLSELGRASGLPQPTAHRLVRTLLDLGYLRQEPSRRYSLGPRLIGLGRSASRMLTTWARPHLAALVDELGETASLAVLEGDHVVHVAHVPSSYSMRVSTELHTPVAPHCTAAGKVLLAGLPPDDAHAVLRRIDLAACTEQTITDVQQLRWQLDRARRHGYATDRGEQEVGVQSIAVPVPGAPTPTAMSISGPCTRMTDALLERAVPRLTAAAWALSHDLDGVEPASSQ